MKDSILKGMLLGIALWMLYFTSLFASVHYNIPIAPSVGGLLLILFWVPQLSYSLPILAMLRRKNLPKTHLGFKIVFILLLLLNIAFLVFVIRSGA